MGTQLAYVIIFVDVSIHARSALRTRRQYIQASRRQAVRSNYIFIRSAALRTTIHVNVEPLSRYAHARVHNATLQLVQAVTN